MKSMAHGKLHLCSSLFLKKDVHVVPNSSDCSGALSQAPTWVKHLFCSTKLKPQWQDLALLLSLLQETCRVSTTAEVQDLAMGLFRCRRLNEY